MKPPKLKTREQRIEWWAGYVVTHFGADPSTARQHAERIVSRAEERKTAQGGYARQFLWHRPSATGRVGA
jgi:hypothetical protein